MVTRPGAGLLGDRLLSAAVRSLYPVSQSPTLSCCPRLRSQLSGRLFPLEGHLRDNSVLKATLRLRTYTGW